MEDNSRTSSVEADIEGEGIVWGIGLYTIGDKVSLKAEAKEGYEFSEWEDGSKDNPRIITVSEVNKYIAKFDKKEPTIKVTASENGTIIKDLVYHDTTYTAVGNKGYVFSEWSDGNRDNPRRITVESKDVTIEAKFTKAVIETVDLGTGTLWATCNVGAANPWDYGYFYAWGETEVKRVYTWGNYKYGSSNLQSMNLTKYCTNSWYGTVDDKNELESGDDAATVELGEEYSMPTSDDWEKLLEECYWRWVDNYKSSGKMGYIVYKAKSDGDKGYFSWMEGTPQSSYSLKDTHIFLPAASVYSGSYENNPYYGYYWSATLDQWDPKSAARFEFSDREFSWASMERCMGCSVRPVKRQKN